MVTGHRARRRLDGSSWPPGLPPLVAETDLAGGWVCDTRRGRLADGREVVVKRAPYPADAEVDGLAALAREGVPVPEVLGHAGSVLVLPYLTGDPDWSGLGQAVAAMHQVTGPAFGWHRDNRAGRFVQENAWCEDWPTFFAERRVRAHLADPSVPPDLRDRLHRACDGPLREVLARDADPVLTHGDLWAGNTVAGRWLVDPEVSYADRELDLAYMLGGDTLPDDFWAAYTAVLPFDRGLEERRPALDLHHLLLQVRHFDPERFRPALEQVLETYGW